MPPDATTRDRYGPVRGDLLRPLESLNPTVPGLIGGLIHRALEVQPARRFQSATEMRRALAMAAAMLTGKEAGPADVSRPSDGIACCYAIPTTSCASCWR